MKKTLLLASLMACTFAHSAELYMAGDSIMADRKPSEWPQYGWGQALKSFMKEPTALHNFARSGWSARRFRESGRWEDCIASQLKPGDWVIVSFGHNDMNKRRNKPPKNDYSTIDEYKAFLKGFADDAKAKGANIAFATSIAHSIGFSETNGVMHVDGGAAGLGPYVDAMRELAAELKVPLLDLNRYAEENLPKLGMENAKALYMTIKPGEHPNYPDGKNDPAHIRDTGAFFYARGAVEMARSQGLPLDGLLKSPIGISYEKFTDGMLSKTKPAGWLERACRVQAEGLTGHPEALSYPYDTCLWAGEIPRMGRHGQDWWRYEQTAYYVDGLLRLGYAMGDEAFIKKGEANVEWTLVHAAPDGHLGHPSLWDAAHYKLKDGYDMWPFAVFFRVMKAKYEAAPDERILHALTRNYLLYSKEKLAAARNIVNVEGMLWTYGRTGDKRLLELAEEAWNWRKPVPPKKRDELSPENCISDAPIHTHGVTWCEELKVPALLYAYTGKREYLDQAVNVERKLVRDHMLPDGCPSSTEWVRGNSVHWGHETCDIADYSWSLGYFLEATGDASYADKIERCVFNAGFGAIGDDFRSLQYFSNPNQFICTSNSDHNPQNYGTTWMQYRPTHETECCAGNVHRILPNYISRMWLKDKDGEPVAALYGPSEADFGWAKIKEETRYPFDGKITFRFAVKEPGEHSFTYRVPGWCKRADAGTFVTVRREFKDGETIVLDFPMEVVFETVPPRFVVDYDDLKRGLKRPAKRFANVPQGTVVTRGPLMFAYPVPAERAEDSDDHANMNGKRSGNPGFKCWNLRPAGPFNYALAAHSAEVVGDATAGDGFFKSPGAVKLRVRVRRIEWTLDENRFTPDIPERPVIIGDGVEAIELVPYGSTMLRLGVFPDVSR